MADLLQLLFTQEADFTPDRTKQLEGLRLILESPPAGALLVAHEGERVVGMVSLLWTISTSEGGAACWLEDLIVHPDCRGQRIGSLLLDAAIDHARSMGCRRITLLTDRTNAEAIRFYERRGFAESAMTALRLPLNAFATE